MCPSYLWAEVLLDTTGETSEIGWLTYPPGGVSVLLPFPARYPYLLSAPQRVEIRKKPLGKDWWDKTLPPSRVGFQYLLCLLCLLLLSSLPRRGVSLLCSFPLPHQGLGS